METRQKKVRGLWECDGVALIAISLMLGGLAGCAKPTEDECRAGIKRMMEIQLDESNAQASSSPLPDGMSRDDMRKGMELMKSGIPSLIRPEFVAQCMDRVKRADLQCTMTASASEDLVKKCHWKVIPGAKGGTGLGF